MIILASEDPIYINYSRLIEKTKEEIAELEEN